MTFKIDMLYQTDYREFRDRRSEIQRLGAVTQVKIFGLYRK